MTQISAKLNNLRISPSKVRAVAELIKGLEVDSAKAQLKYLAKRAAVPLEKLLDSAIANAKHNKGLGKDFLYIKELTIDEGMKLKRYKAKGFGSAMPVQRKTSHVEIVLEELPEDRKKKKGEILARRPKIEEAKKEAKTEERKEEAKTDQKPKIKKEEEKVSKKGSFGGIKTLGRRLFRRKAI